MELAKIFRMFNGCRRYSAFRIVSLMFKCAEPIDGSHKIVGLERVRGISRLCGMTKRLDPFLRCFCKQVGKRLQWIKRFAMEFIQTEQEARVFQLVRRVVCAPASMTGTPNTPAERERPHGYRLPDGRHHAQSGERAGRV